MERKLEKGRKQGIKQEREGEKKIERGERKGEKPE